MDYVELLKSIQNRKCALVLGPMVCLTKDRKTTFSENIATHLMAGGKDFIYYPNDDLYYIPARSARTWACNEIQNKVGDAIADMNTPGFYTPLYQLITKIPFHLILSLSPDKFLFNWMEHKGLSPQFASFSITDPTASFEKPTRERPLIFNLFGETEKAESLILTQEDFYKYLNEVFTNTKKLEELRTAMRDINYLLFLGFPLDRWYVKLLMLLLEVNSDSKYIALSTNPWRDNFQKKEPVNLDDPQLMELENFCGRHFKIAFAKENFMEFLFALYKAAKAEMKKPKPVISLRTQNAADPPPAPQVNHKQRVAVSYATDGKSVEIAEKIIQELGRRGYEVLNEKISISYLGNVHEFISKMGSGQAVVTIVSDKYLKDRKCMEVALAMEKYQNLEARIFPIVLDDALIYDAFDRIDYLTYWAEECNKINVKLQGLADKAYTKSIQAELDLCSDIRRFTDGYVSILKNMNCLSPEKHKGENFETLISAIETRFLNDAKNPAP